MGNKKILVVEDERDIAELIAFDLERDYYNVESMLSTEEVISNVKECVTDLIVIDLKLPDLNGLNAYKLLRSDPSTKNIPIIVLSEKVEEFDVVSQLEIGVDDYFTKPFSPKTFITRIREILQQGEKNNEETSFDQQLGELTINKANHRVMVFENTVELTRTEFSLLSVLADRPGWVFSRSQLIDTLRDSKHLITERDIDIHILSLRKKLGPCGDCIQTVRGVGYRMKE